MPAGRSDRGAGPAPAVALAAAHGARRCCVLALIPAVLTLLYLPSFVHPVSTLMLKDLLTFQGYDRRWVPIDDISPVLIAFGDHVGRRPVLLPSRRRLGAAQRRDRRCDGRRADPRRLDHHHADGQEPLSLARPLLRAQGDRAAARRSISTLVLSKRRIMEIYLNIAEWGAGIYGAEAAAQHHFGRSATRPDPAAGGTAGRRAAQSGHPQPGKPGPGCGGWPR